MLDRAHSHQHSKPDISFPDWLPSVVILPTDVLGVRNFKKHRLQRHAYANYLVGTLHPTSQKIPSFLLLWTATHLTTEISLYLFRLNVTLQGPIRKNPSVESPIITENCDEPSKETASDRCSKCTRTHFCPNQ